MSLKKRQNRNHRRIINFKSLMTPKRAENELHNVDYNLSCDEYFLLKLSDHNSYYRALFVHSFGRILIILDEKVSLKKSCHSSSCIFLFQKVLILNQLENILQWFLKISCFLEFIPIEYSETKIL